MMELESHLVRVFHSKKYSGSLAGVVVENKNLKPDDLMQLAKKLQVPDVAWIQPTNTLPKIKFYTPACKIKFCGHATLAAGLIMQRKVLSKAKQITFQSESDLLQVRLQGLVAEMRSRRVAIQSIQPPLGYLNQYPWFEGGEDYVVLFPDEESVRQFRPKLHLIRKLKKRGLVITASNQKGRYALRFFAPQSGINEDPCTGSVQSVLGDLWKCNHKCSEFQVVQLSKSGGCMKVRVGLKYIYVTGKVQLIERDSSDTQ